MNFLPPSKEPMAEHEALVATAFERYAAILQRTAVNQPDSAEWFAACLGRALSAAFRDTRRERETMYLRDGALSWALLWVAVRARMRRFFRGAP